MKRSISVALFAAFFSLWASAASAVACFWVGGSGNYDGVTTTHWANVTGGTASSCTATGGVPHLPSDSATFDANSTGTITVTSATLSLSGLSFSNFAGIFDNSVNNEPITIGGGFSVAQASGAGTIHCGTGTYTLTGVNSSVNISNITSVTLDCTSATFSFASSGNGGKFITLTGASWGNVSFSASNGAGTLGTTTITPGTGGTLASLSITGPNRLTFVNAATLTVTAGLNINPGGGAAAIVTLITPSVTGPGTISSANSGVCNWCVLGGMAFTGGGTFTAPNSFDVKGNSGITITNPAGSGGGPVHIIGG